MRINSTDFSRFRFRVDKKLVENVSDERGTYIYKAINDPSKTPPWPIIINPDHVEDVTVYVHEFTELCLTVLIFNILYREMEGESIIVPPYIPSHDLVLLSLGYSERDMFENEDTRTLDCERSHNPATVSKLESTSWNR